MTKNQSPSPVVRLLAVFAILVSGLCGGLIGYRVTVLQCSGDCANVAGVVGVVSAIACAMGVGVVTVLALRASLEWNAKQKLRRVHAQPPTDGTKPS